MRRVLLRLTLAASLLIIIVAVVAMMVLRASLPALDGEIEVDGLLANARIARDVDGIPVITASSRTDLAFATGFAHGQDRFFQMDMIRRQAAGELSDIVGGVAIDTDKRHRFHRFRSKAQAVIANAEERDRALLVAYANGVNAGLQSLEARPFEYFVLGGEPKLWLPEDSVLVVFAMYMQLNDARAIKDVRRGLARRVLPEEVYKWMYPQGTPW
ncbi:MAG: penicillin acylase family protein, partial [Woeseiaceae bacterium]